MILELPVAILDEQSPQRRLSAPWEPQWRTGLKTSVPPEWLAHLALATHITPALVGVAASLAQVELSLAERHALIEALGTAGLLEDSPVAGVPASLNRAARQSMLAELSALDGGVERARKDLLRAGMAMIEDGLVVQLVIWASQAREWAILEQVWIATTRIATFVGSEEAIKAFLDVPKEQRQHFPALSYAHALMLARSPCGTQLEADEVVRGMLREGRELHSRWRMHRNTDALVLAGTMWMWAQSSLGGSINDPQLDSAWETHLAVENAITERTGRGDPPSTRTLVFFHSISAATALLRADWDRARLHAGLGAATSNGGDYFGMAAKVALALIGQLMGNTEESHGFGRSEIGAAGNPLPAAAVNGNVSSSVTQLLNLGQILEAILRLDRNGARELLAKRGRSVSAMRLFNYAPIVVWIQSIGNTLWADPPAALAEFDAALKGRDLSGGSPDQWTALLMRIRAELLLNLGAPNRAENLIATLLATDRWVALVPAARLQLAVGNPERAISLADEGIYSLKLSMLDRAHLHAIRAAASLAAGAEADEVDRQIRSAGMFCLEAGTAVPFAMLPQELRASLVDLHHPHADGSYCLLLDVAARGGFDNLRQSFPSKNLLIHLTPREKILLPLLGTKATLQEIAQGQFVSVNTVRKQVVSLRKKLGAKNRAEVLPRAHELGLMQNS